MLTIQERRHKSAVLEPVEHTVTLRDGAELFYRAWLPAEPTTKALLLFHRGHEHSGRWQETARALGSDDVAVFAWDQRGHGLSSGERGTARDLATVIRDVEEWVHHLRTTHGIELPETVVLAHSLVPSLRQPGPMIMRAADPRLDPRHACLPREAVRAVGRTTPPVAAAIIRSWVCEEFPQGKHAHPRRGAGHALQRRPADLSADRGEHAPRPARYLDAAAGRRRAINVPLLVLAASSDWVVHERAQRQFVERASSPVKRFEVLTRFSHAIFHEQDRRLAVEKVRKFIGDCFAGPSSAPSLQDADRQGFTHDEHERLKAAGRPLVRTHSLADEGTGPAEPRHRPRLETRL